MIRSFSRSRPEGSWAACAWTSARSRCRWRMAVRARWYQSGSSAARPAWRFMSAAASWVRIAAIASSMATTRARASARVAGGAAGRAGMSFRSIMVVVRLRVVRGAARRSRAARRRPVRPGASRGRWRSRRWRASPAGRQGRAAAAGRPAAPAAPALAPARGPAAAARRRSFSGRYLIRFCSP